MADEDMVVVDGPAPDAGANLAVALIVLTTVMLLAAIFATYKLLGDRYHEGPLASSAAPAK
jgi:hypothetical protein